MLECLCLIVINDGVDQQLDWLGSLKKSFHHPGEDPYLFQGPPQLGVVVERTSD